MVEVREGPAAVSGDVDIDGVKPRPCLSVYQVVQRRPLQQRDQRRHKEDERQHAIVEREDAEEAPHVEVSEVARVVAGVVEDASDEEAGQDEEQLNAVGPEVGHADDRAFDRVARRHVADEVEQHDHQDGQATDPVQHRHVSTRVGPRAGARRPELCGRRRDYIYKLVDRADRGFWKDGHDSPMRSRGMRAPGEGPGLPGLWLLDLYAALPSGKGPQYRPTSAATIRNTTHKNSKPRIHKLSKKL